MWRLFFTYTTGDAPVEVAAPNEYSATIMRASVINNSVSALVASIASQGGTLVAALNQSTIMRADAKNTAGTMRADALNQNANLT